MAVNTKIEILYLLLLYPHLRIMASEYINVDNLKLRRILNILLYVIR
jgi:hypothetical protein